MIMQNSTCRKHVALHMISSLQVRYITWGSADLGQSCTKSRVFHEWCLHIVPLKLVCLAAMLRMQLSPLVHT